MTESYHQACVGTRSEAACVHCIARKRKPISRPCYYVNAGWSSLVARWAHNPKVEGSNPSPATNYRHKASAIIAKAFFIYGRQCAHTRPDC